MSPAPSRRCPFSPRAPQQQRPTYVVDLVGALLVWGDVGTLAELEERGQQSVSARAGATRPAASLGMPAGGALGRQRWDSAGACLRHCVALA